MFVELSTKLFFEHCYLCNLSCGNTCKKLSPFFFFLSIHLFPLKWYQILEVVVQRCFVKKVFLEISQNSQENTCVRVSFLIRPATLLKRDSDTGVFLSILRNFFLQNTSGQLLLFLFLLKNEELVYLVLTTKLVRDLTHCRIRSRHRRCSVKEDVRRKELSGTGDFL